MNKKLVVALLIIMLVVTLAFVSCQDNDGGDNGTVSQDNYFVKFKTLKVEGYNVSGTVANATTDFSFILEVEVNADTTYTVCADKTCKDVIPSKTVDLVDGDNVYYVLASRGNEVQLYTVTLHRKAIFTVTFDTDGGSAIAQQEVEEGGAINNITAPVKTGYTFVNFTAGGNVVTFPYAVTSNVTLKATYTANTYKITYDANGGNMTKTELAVTYDQPYTLAVPTRVGYLFDGWYLDDTKLTNGNGQSLAVWTFNEDKTVTAKWSNTNITVTFDTDGGSDVAPLSDVAYNSLMAAPTRPEKSGYTFAGWYKEQTFTNKWSFASDRVRQSVTLYARWLVPTSGLQFTLNDDGNSYMLSGRGTSTDLDVVIPATYNGKPVTKIFGGYSGSECFSEDTTSIFIPDGVEEIGPTAFMFTRICEITIPSSVTSLGVGVLAATFSLRSITVEEGNPIYYSSGNCIIEKSSQTVIAGCTNSVIPNGVLAIKWAFAYMAVTEINIPSSVKTIGDGAFFCSTIWHVTIPRSVTSIAENAFQGCEHLLEVCNESSLNIVKGATTYGCVAQNALNVYKPNDGESNLVEDNGFVFYVSQQDGIRLLCYKGEESDVVLPQDYDGFEYDFELLMLLVGKTRLTSITMPDFWTYGGVSEIYNYCDVPELRVRNTHPTITFDGGVLYNKNKTEILFVSDINGEFIIPNTVETVGGFSYRTGLTSIVIPEGVKHIGSDAFAGCNGLTSITIPSSVISIGNGAFSHCANLQTVYWNVTNEIDSDYMSKWFAQCDKLTNIVFGPGVTSIPAYAFDYCSGLVSVTIPEQIISVGECAFSHCSNLTTVYWNAQLVGNNNSGCDSVFAHSDKLSEVIIGDNVTDVYYGIFNDCRNLTAVTLGRKVEYIGNEAFDNCNILEIYNRSQLQLVKGSQSNGKIALNALNIYDENGSSSIVETADGYVFYYDGENVPLLLKYVGNELNVTLPQNYDGKQYAIYQSAFANSQITSVVIPDGVTEIGANAFSYCRALTEITIPGTVKTIGEYAFYYCDNLKTVIIEQGVADIASRAFYSCYALTEITIPGTVKTIGAEAFIYCNKLKTVIMEQGVVRIGYDAFESCSALTSVSIPDSIEFIKYSAFRNCDNLRFNVYNGARYLGNSDNPYLVWVGMEASDVTTLELHEGLKIINYITYNEGNDNKLANLTSVAIGDNNAYFSSYCGVLYNKDRTEIVYVPNQIGGVLMLPDTLTEIPSSAFYQRKNLRGVVIGEGVTKIGSNAFSGCVMLQSVVFNAVNAQCEYNVFSNVGVNGAGILFTVGKDVTNIPNYLIGESCKIVTLVIKDDCTLKEIRGVFSNCKQLSTVVIGNGVERIEWDAFRNCDSLTSLYIPSSVTEVGSNIVRYYNKLTIYCQAESKPDGWDDNWNDGCYVVWQKSPEAHTYSFVTNCDAEVEDITAVVLSDLPVITNGNLVFVGWYKQADFTGKPIATGYVGATDETFYARWIDVEALGQSSGLAIRDGVIVGIGTCTDKVLTINLPVADNAFGGANITSVVLGEGCTSIGESAFSGCSRLASVTIGKDVLRIGGYAFSGCEALKTFRYNATACEDVGNSIFGWSSSDQQSLEIIIGKDVDSVPNYLFRECYQVTKVTFEDGAKKVWQNMFECCFRLQTVVLPSSITQIRVNAFRECSNLREIRYDGTREQWSQISKSGWNEGVSGDCVIRCTDGVGTVETVRVYFASPVEYTSISMEYTDGENVLFVFNSTSEEWEEHHGVDLSADDGTAVTAMYDGTVLQVTETSDMGKIVKIDHGNNVVALYASLAEVTVVAGNIVKKGDKIGETSTSASNESKDGAHLHLEVINNGVNVDPMPYVSGEIFYTIEVWDMRD